MDWAFSLWRGLVEEEEKGISYDPSFAKAETGK
jgi:hypothetical protein